jgi:putative CRISPR-associated protein (TIGR02619 family)
MPRLILSPVGTSIFGAVERRESHIDIQLMKNGANLPPENPPDDHASLADTLKEHALSHAEMASTEALREASAELNAIFGLGEADASDMHLLVSTDTLYGRTAADAVAHILRSRGASVDILMPQGLTTETPEAFAEGIKKLFQECGNQIPTYREHGYEVVFNLTGGFKGLQGYLNAIGMLYADRMVYIFARSKRLIEIPRLPLQLDASADLEAYRVELLLLDAGYPVTLEDVSGLSDVFFDMMDGVAVLTEWGTALWGTRKADLLKGSFPEIPHVEYGSQVRKDIKAKARPAEHLRILERLAAVAAQWEEEPGEAALRQNIALQAGRLKHEKTSEGDPLFRFRLGEYRLIFSLADDGVVLQRYLSRGEAYEGS